MGKEESKKVDAGPVPTADEEVAPVREEKEAPAKAVPDSENSILARVQTEKRFALIKAWEENEKAKIDNKAHKKLSDIGSWENTKKALVEAKIKQYEEKLEMKRAQYAEKMKNQVAEIRKAAEEKKAAIEAERLEECHKAEGTAQKFRETGYTPRKFLGCFGS